MSFLLINYTYGSSTEGLECYKENQTNASNITKATDELKSDNVCMLLFGCFRERGYLKHGHIHMVEVIYRTRIVGRRQVTVRFMK